MEVGKDFRRDSLFVRV